MLKSIMMSLWLMGLLAGSAYYFGSQPEATGNTGKSESVLAAEYVKLDPITVAVVRSSEVRGYVILEVAIAIDKKARGEAEVPLAPSNEAFDASLKARDAAWGLRDRDAVVALARSHGLALTLRTEMPANNISLMFRRV